MMNKWTALRETIRLERKERENRAITKYKLEESIKTKFKKLGVEDLANDIIEYINFDEDED